MPSWKWTEEVLLMLKQTANIQDGLTPSELEYERKGDEIKQMHVLLSEWIKRYSSLADEDGRGAATWAFRFRYDDSLWLLATALELHFTNTLNASQLLP
jgi:hypothetical protein